MIQLHLRIHVAGDQREAFLRFLRDAIPFYEQPGGIRIRLLSDMHDPSRFVEVVEYETREAYERDQQRVEHDPAMQDYLRRWRALLTGPPLVEVYAEVKSTAVGGMLAAVGEHVSPRAANSVDKTWLPNAAPTPRARPPGTDP